MCISCMLSRRNCSKIVMKRTETLCRADAVFEPKSQPLNPFTVCHPFDKCCRVRGIDLLNRRKRKAFVKRNVVANRPASVDLIFWRQQVVVQQFRALRVRGVLQDCPSLGPRHKLGFGRKRRLNALSGIEVIEAGKGSRNGLIG